MKKHSGFSAADEPCRSVCRNQLFYNICFPVFQLPPLIEVCRKCLRPRQARSTRIVNCAALLVKGKNASLAKGRPLLWARPMPFVRRRTTSDIANDQSAPVSARVREWPRVVSTANAVVLFVLRKLAAVEQNVCSPQPS